MNSDRTRQQQGDNQSGDQQPTSQQAASQQSVGEASEGAAAQDASAELRVLRAPEVLEDQVRPLFGSRSTRLIKAQVVASLEEAAIDIERARARAEEIVDQARTQADEIRDEARKEGQATGIEEVVEYIVKARDEYTRTVEKAEDDLLELSFCLARRIVGAAIEIEPTRVRQMVRDVLGHARGKREIVVSIAPEDQVVLEEASDMFSRQVDNVPVHFEADPALERGSCVIQTESGRIDGRIETQLESLLRALKGA